jgi:hypothetical protein
MPKRLAAAISACETASERAPRTGSTGAVPNGRVSCPNPCRMTSLQEMPPIMSAWCGATPPPSASAPTHTPTSWAIFSSSVMSGSSASARAVGGSAGSCQRCAAGAGSVSTGT